MRFLLDNAISPLMADGLRDAGYDAEHVRDCGLQASDDKDVFARAAEEERILISTDTDFGTLLALWGESKPSVILFRRTDSYKPDYLLDLLLRNLPHLEVHLNKGCVAVLEKTRVRIRALPIIRTEPHS